MSLLRTFATLLSVALTLPSTSAAMIEIKVSGRIGVDDSRNLLPDVIRTGEPWSGWIRYSTELVDQNDDPSRGYFADPLNPFGLSLGVVVHGYVFAGGDGDLQAEVLNDIPNDLSPPFNPPPGDSFSIGGPMNRSPRLLDHSSISYAWNDVSAVTLLSDSLPWSFDPFGFVQNDGGTGLPTYSPIYLRIEDIGLSTPTSPISYTIIASIEYAEIRVIPEPSSQVIGVLAFSTMLFSLAGCQWHPAEEKRQTTRWAGRSTAASG